MGPYYSNCYSNCHRPDFAILRYRFDSLIASWLESPMFLCTISVNLKHGTVVCLFSSFDSAHSDRYKNNALDYI